jgi:hypothetical protein
VTQNIARPDFVRAFVDAFGGVRIVELMELALDSDVVSEIKGGIGTVASEVLRPVVGVSVDKQGADLQITGAGCRRERLSMETSGGKADQTDQQEVLNVARTFPEPSVAVLRIK